MLLLMCLHNCFKIRSKKLLSLMVRYFDCPIIGLSLRSLGFEMVISSLFCSLIALCKISDLRIIMT